jgi:hypothetical protein
MMNDLMHYDLEMKQLFYLESRSVDLALFLFLGIMRI